MTVDSRKVCFVVMGFGKKTDYESGRTLDLDATYESIISPAAEKAGLRCIRADEIMHSGVIDVEMFEMLLRADLVVADISTGNVNAVYELGVRHALRPNSAIIMTEDAGRLYFDLNHIGTFKYQHLGQDIGAREAMRASKDLGDLIEAVLQASKPDSPVYTYLPKLQQPLLTDEQYASLLDKAEVAQEHFFNLIKTAEAAAKTSQHQEAAEAFASALLVKPGDPYLTQQLALHTYKTELPSKLFALISGLAIISQLSPDKSNDPETVAIAGAIHKRIWIETEDIEHLNAAIRFYSRGYEIRRDYYSGENLAICFDYRAPFQSDEREAEFDRMSAKKVRLSLIELLLPITKSTTFDERRDKRWIYATLANISFALGFTSEANEYEGRFLSERPAQWEIDTYNASKNALPTLTVGLGLV